MEAEIRQVRFALPHATSAPGLGTPRPHLHVDWVHPVPHLHWDWEHPLPHLHGTGNTPATSALGLGTPTATSAPGLGSPPPTSAPGLESPPPHPTGGRAGMYVAAAGMHHEAWATAEARGCGGVFLSRRIAPRSTSLAAASQRGAPGNAAGNLRLLLPLSAQRRRSLPCMLQPARRVAMRGAVQRPPPNLNT
jgi:hypothetical protein